MTARRCVCFPGSSGYCVMHCCETVVNNVFSTIYLLREFFLAVSMLKTIVASSLDFNYLA